VTTIESERLRAWIEDGNESAGVIAEGLARVDEALAAERHATVERIEERVESHIAAHSGKLTGDYLQGLADAVAMGHAILDAER
jgi:hypothetical protein